MKIRSYKYHIKQGAKNITKNGLMSVASIVSVSICSFMLIISLCLAINLNIILEKIEESIGISIYIGEDVTDEEIQGIYDEIKEVPNVTSVEYMSKQDALNWAKDEWGNESGILSGFENDNPFPRSYEISINGAKYQKGVIEAVTKIQNDFEYYIVKENKEEKEKVKKVLDDEEINKDLNEETKQNDKKIGDKDYSYTGIRKIRHSQKESDILLAINNTIRVGSMALIIILGIVAVTIIVNTIKLTVYVRKDEINIMKYVGATDWFIRWPFVIEGLIIGLIGSVIPVIICIIGYIKIVDVIYENIPIITSYGELKDTFALFLAVAPVTIILGMILGVVGSVHSVKKHLNV